MEKVFWAGEDGSQQLQERARRLLEAPTRQILGIAGAPGSAKSTLAAALLTELERTGPGTVVLVGMDAFHLGHRLLERHGLVSFKGAPETFDRLGYLSLLARIKNSAETIYAPEFHREIEDSIAHNIEVPEQIRLLITEGNYLLLPRPPVEPDPSTPRRRLVHPPSGRRAEAADGEPARVPWVRPRNRDNADTGQRRSECAIDQFSADCTGSVDRESWLAGPQPPARCYPGHSPCSSGGDPRAVRRLSRMP
jgi:energy-coupling factor transporter ATP-binding protein EcfA2